MPLISRGLPAYTNDDCSGSYPASLANDNTYDTTWQACGTPSASSPDWLAYDLSKVPASQRGRVLLVWYNETGNYDHTVINDYAYNNIQDYTIDVNAAPGGGSAPPTTGWVTKVTVTGNHFHSRQHVFDMIGYNWLRITVKAPDGSSQNYGVNINMDVYDASHGTADDWIFYGGSIFADSLGHQTAGGIKAFQQLINAQSPIHYPVEEDGGIGYLTSSDGATYLPKWLPLFPGHFVALGYGTNDALSCADPNTFYNNYVTMVQTILKAGKVPLVQKILWGPNSNIQLCAPALNAKIDQLNQNFPQVIPGPDTWTYFKNNPSLIGTDGIHPNDQGAGALRQLWATTALTTVYGGTIPAPPQQRTTSPTPDGTTGLLPGQQIWNNGVSSFLFGTNDSEDYDPDNFVTDPHNIIQPSLKSAGLTVMREFIDHYSQIDGHRTTLGTNPQIQLHPDNPHEYDQPLPLQTNVTPNQPYQYELETRIKAIENSGMQCLIVFPDIYTDPSHPTDHNPMHKRIIDHDTGQLETDLDFAKKVVAYAANRCNMYEIGNEPDLDSAVPHLTINEYLQRWNEFVPALRAINPNAKFFGPVSYDDQGNDCYYNGTPTVPGTQPGECYIAMFMRGTKLSGVLPDGITFHYYPCDNASNGFPPATGNCGPKEAASFTSAIDQVRNWEHQIYGNTIPKLGITEWNFDPGSNPLGENATFMSQFTQTAMQAMISAGLDFANQYDTQCYCGYGYLDMFDIGNNDRPKAQFTVMARLVKQYKSDSSATPTLTPEPTNTVDATNASKPMPTILIGNGFVGDHFIYRKHTGIPP